MDINVTVKVEGLSELSNSIALLASAIGAHAGAQMKGTGSVDYEAAAKQAVAHIDEAADEPKQEKPKAPAKAKAEKPKPQPAKEPEPAEEPEPQDTQEPSDESDAEYTLEKVRAYLAPISRAGHATKVKALIKKHGKAENIADADPSTYGAVLEAAKTLRLEVGMEDDDESIPF